MNRTIEIIIAPNGHSRVETKGFTGSECRQTSQFIERTLGQQIGEVLKAEFYQATESHQRVKKGK